MSDVFIYKEDLLGDRIKIYKSNPELTNSFTKGYIAGRKPLDSNFYNLDYFLGKKVHQGVQFPVDGSYLNPESSVKFKFIDIVKWVSKYVQNGNILDVGTGPGHFNYWSKKLKKKFKVFGCDICKELNHGNNYNDNFKICSASNLDYPANTFSAILYSDILEHLNPEDVFKSLKDGFEMLKHKGFIFVRIPNRITWNKKTLRDQAHVWLPSIGEINQLLIEIGFEPSSIQTFTRGFPFSDVFFKVFGFDLRLPFFGTTIYTLAQKS